MVEVREKLRIGLPTLGDWNVGVSEVSFCTVIFMIFLGLPFFLSNKSALDSFTVQFYVILFIIGLFSLYVLRRNETIQEFIKEMGAPEPTTKKQDIFLGIAMGGFGFLLIQMLFTLQLIRLETTPSDFIFDRTSLILLQMAFVVPAEELVFRDTLPLYLSLALKKVKGGTYWAFVISAITFGTLHSVAYRFDYIAISLAIVAGLILGLIRIIGGLFASYIAHMLYNVLNLLGLFIFPILIST